MYSIKLLRYSSRMKFLFQLQPRTKLLRHFNAIFNFPPCNHRFQKEQTCTPGTMLWRLNSSKNFLCYRKQHCNRGGLKQSLFATVSIFVRVSAKNRYFCNVSQQVFSEVVACLARSVNKSLVLRFLIVKMSLSPTPNS